MKKISLLPLFALVLAFAASAFTNRPHPSAQTNLQLWQYEPVNLNGPSDPANYVKLEDAQQTFECDGSTIVCEIEAAENMSTHRPLIGVGDDPSVQTETYNTSFRDE